MNDKPYVVGLTCARGGSKGVPRKNIRPLAGKPLIGYSVEAGLASALVSRMFVSTDDPEIAQAARSFGAEAPFLRPGDLARDDSPEWLTWRHFAAYLRDEDPRGLPDAVVNIPCTAPLRRVQDLDACIAKLLESDADIVLTVTDPPSNPYFTMVTLGEGGEVRRLMEGQGVVFRRQEAPRVYDITPVAYAWRPRFALEKDSMFAGRMLAIYVPPEYASDIDTELQFQFYDFLLSRSAAGSGGPRP